MSLSAREHIYNGWIGWGFGPLSVCLLTVHGRMNGWMGRGKGPDMPRPCRWVCCSGMKTLEQPAAAASSHSSRQRSGQKQKANEQWAAYVWSFAADTGHWGVKGQSRCRACHTASWRPMVPKTGRMRQR